MKIVSQTSKDASNASFYIARVGLVGKPLKEAYTASNSFAVISDNPEMDFQRVKAAYEAGAFEMFAYGTCQQFIRIKDAREVVARTANMNERYLKAMAAQQMVIDLEEQKLAKQKEILKTMQQQLFASC